MLDLVRKAWEMGATDLLLVPGSPPLGRLEGRLVPLGEALDARAVGEGVRGLLSERQLARLEGERELDFSLSVPGIGRIRGNAFFRLGQLAAALRRIPDSPPSLAELGLEGEVVPELGKRAGLILVAGPAGSGKTTVLNAAVAWMAAHRPVHVVMVEDPVEYLHPPALGTVSQREVGTDTTSFASAIRSALRQSPDVIVIGEVRDQKTAESLLVAAQTGHLVLASLHGQNAPEAVEKLIGLAGEEARREVADSLLAVYALRLLNGLTGGKVLAAEVLLATPAIRSLVREGKPHQIRPLMAGAPGMRTLEQALALLVKRGLVSPEEASKEAVDRTDLVWQVHGLRPG